MIGATEEELMLESVSMDSDQEALMNSKKQKKKEAIYNEEMLKQKLSEITKTFKRQFKDEPIPWTERLLLTSQNEVTELEGVDVNDDVKREVQFYNIALENLKKGLVLLDKHNMRIDRPPDYYAEMFKNDQVMSKIRNSLVKQQVRIRNFEEQKLKKNARFMQKQRRHEKNLEMAKNKKKNLAGIEKWKKDLKSKKGQAGDLEAYIQEQKDRGNEKKKKFQNLKNKKIKKGKRQGKNQRAANMHRKKSNRGRKR